jgi:CHAD domain-containing protein
VTPGPFPPPHALTRGALALEDAAERCRERADDEAVHDLRVAARRLDSVLWTWAPLLRPRSRREARSRLRTLRRRAGDAREAEVGAALLATRIPLAEAGQQEALLEAQTLLNEQRELAERTLTRRISLPRVTRIVRRLRRAWDPDRVAADPDAGYRLLRERADTRRRRALTRLTHALHPLDDLASRSLDDLAMHEARLALKRWRYAEESLAGTPAEVSAPYRELRDLQKVLGTIHDHAMLRDALTALAQRWNARGKTVQAAALAACAASLEHERRVLTEHLRETATPLLAPHA